MLTKQPFPPVFTKQKTPPSPLCSAQVLLNGTPVRSGGRIAVGWFRAAHSLGVARAEGPASEAGDGVFRVGVETGVTWEQSREKCKVS